MNIHEARANPACFAPTKKKIIITSNGSALAAAPPAFVRIIETDEFRVREKWTADTLSPGCGDKYVVCHLDIYIFNFILSIKFMIKIGYLIEKLNGNIITLSHMAVEEYIYL